MDSPLWRGTPPPDHLSQMRLAFDCEGFDLRKDVVTLGIEPRVYSLVGPLDHIIFFC